MARVTVDDEKHTTIQDIFCIPGPYKIYQQVLLAHAGLNISLGIRLI